MGGSRKYLTKAREIEQCVSKRKYHTEQEAAIAAKKTALTGRWYRCPGLKGERKHWHVTGGAKWYVPR